MKSIGRNIYRRAACLACVLASLPAVLPATEVAGQTDFFPSPTGSYENPTAVIVSHSSDIKCRTTHLRMALPPFSPPAPGTRSFACTVNVALSSDGGTIFTETSARASMSVSLAADATGVPGSFDTEMLALTISGLPGGVMIRESPTLASTGHHKSRTVPSGTVYVDSFFDVFTELSVDGGATWLPGSVPTHLELAEPSAVVTATGDYPPTGTVTSCPTEISFPSLVVIRDVALKSGSPIATLPFSGVLTQNTNTGRATGQISLDGGATFAPFACEYSGKRKMGPIIHVALGKVYDDSFESLLLSGGTLPSGVRVRESPTKASLGRTSIRRGTDGLFRICGFFDIFTEVSLDHGASWSPADGPPAVFGFNPVEIAAPGIVCPSRLLLPPLSHFETGDKPVQEDFTEFPDGTMVRGFQVSLPSSSVSPPLLGTPPQIQNVDCTVQMEVSLDGGVNYEPVSATATAAFSLHAVAGGAGAPASVYDTEMLSMDLSAPLLSGSVVRIRESPTKASLGRTSLRSAPDGTTLVDSFFDVFTELSLDGGATWSVGPVKRMTPKVSGREREASTPSYPPANSVLACGRAIRCPEGPVLRQVRVHAIHNGDSLPAAGASKTFSFTTTASGEISLDGGATFTSWTGDCTGTAELTHYLDDDDDGDGLSDSDYYDSELLSLTLSGGSLGPVMVRESPSKASVGRASLRSIKAGHYAVSNFFDVFTELSTDSGATWTAASGLPATFAFDAPPQEHFYASPALPLPGDYVSDAPLELSSGITLYRLRKRPEILYQAWDNTIDDFIASFGGTMEGEISTDGGATLQPFRTPYTEEVRLGSLADSGDRPMESLSLNFSVIAGGQTVMIRESPTLPSRGGTSLRESPTLPSRGKTPLREAGAGYMVGSFFDIFTEMSIDGGIVWSPQSNRLHLDLLPYVECDNVFRTDSYPPRTGSFESAPAASPVSFGGGAVIRNMRVRLNELETRLSSLGLLEARTITTPCLLDGDLSLDGGHTWSQVSAPAEVTLHVSRPTSDPSFFDTEMLTITASGGSLPAGVMIRESPTLPSKGRVLCTSRLMEEEGIFYKLDSFFDVFTELSLDDGATWSPADGACNLSLRATTTGVFNPSDWQVLPAMCRSVDPMFEVRFEGTDATISGMVFETMSGVTAPPPAPGESLYRQCTCPAGFYMSTAPGVAKKKVQATCNADSQCMWDTGSSSLRVLKTEITSLNLAGDSLASGMMLRESPTRRSTGATTLRSVPGGYQIDSFFDIFTELSLDGGRTWHAACSPIQMEAVDATVPRRFGMGGQDPLPPVGFSSLTQAIPPRSSSGDKPTSVQFQSLLDSMVNFVDDRHVIGLRNYDVSIVYSIGDTAVSNRATAPLHFGYSATQLGDIDADGRTIHDIEVTTFDLQGGTLPAGIRVRESPTLPSHGRCTRVPQADGSASVVSFFDVFIEFSHDNGATWEPVDQPLHFTQQDRSVSVLSHSDQFSPPGNYVQRGREIRCDDGFCVTNSLAFTSPPEDLPTTPGGKRVYPVQGFWSSAEVTRPGVASVPASGPVDTVIQLTLTDTIGATKYFDVEVLGLTMGGTTSPAGFRIRESPTRQSLGKYTITDVGGGQYRIGSFFDIFTELSFDGGQTWSESEGPVRLELAAPEIEVGEKGGAELADGSSTVDFGVLLSGSTVARPLGLANIGSADLGDLAFTLTGPDAADFTISAPTTLLGPQTKTEFAILLTGGGTGTRSAKLHIASNDSDENTFDIDLTARVLAPNADDDGDGLSNVAEMNLASNPLFNPSGVETFNPLFESSSKLDFLRANGLFLASDVQALNIDVPLLVRDPATGQCTLTLGVQRSTDLQHFDPFPMTAPQITVNPQGKIEFTFPSPASASFFRVEAP
jgi:hypothetical protein